MYNDAIRRLRVAIADTKGKGISDESDKTNKDTDWKTSFKKQASRLGTPPKVSEASPEAAEAKQNPTDLAANLDELNDTVQCVLDAIHIGDHTQLSRLCEMLSAICKKSQVDLKDILNDHISHPRTVQTETMLGQALRLGRYDCANILIEHGAQLPKPDDTVRRAIEAIHNGDPTKLSICCETLFVICKKSKKDLAGILNDDIPGDVSTSLRPETMVGLAFRLGQYECAQTLIQRGAQLPKSNDIVERAMEAIHNGAHRALSNWCQTLFVICNQSQADLEDILNADIPDILFRHETMLGLAFRLGQYVCAQILIKRGAQLPSRIMPDAATFKNPNPELCIEVLLHPELAPKVSEEKLKELKQGLLFTCVANNLLGMLMTLIDHTKREILRAKQEDKDAKRLRLHCDLGFSGEAYVLLAASIPDINPKILWNLLNHDMIPIHRLEQDWDRYLLYRLENFENQSPDKERQNFLSLVDLAVRQVWIGRRRTPDKDQAKKDKMEVSCEEVKNKWIRVCPATCVLQPEFAGKYQLEHQYTLDELYVNWLLRYVPKDTE